MRSRVVRGHSTRLIPAAIIALSSSVFVAAVVSPSGRMNAGSSSDRAPALAAFERLKALQGDWKGSSSKGWEETITLRLIAKGTVLAEDSRFADDSSGGNRMATMIQLDGDRLLLTHYCEAGNTPRLVATGFDDGGRTITFTFLDGINLPSRDRGHMDKVVLRLQDDKSYSSRWTWYENGKETWFEEIRFERIR